MMMMKVKKFVLINYHASATRSLLTHRVKLSERNVHVIRVEFNFGMARLSFFFFILHALRKEQVTPFRAMADYVTAIRETNDSMERSAPATLRSTVVSRATTRLRRKTHTP